MGIVNVVFVLLLTDDCELNKDGKGEEVYSRVAQEDQARDDHHSEEVPEPSLPNVPVQLDVEAASPPPTPIRLDPPQILKPKNWLSRRTLAFSSMFTQISHPTRHVMYKLWFLLIIDSLADGMVPYALTNYYMDIKFHPSKATLGDVSSLSYFLGGIGAVFAGPLARKIGLINTMVFTHVPSSAAVLFFPLAPYFWITALFLLIRTGLNNMDQAPRSAFIAAVVKPEERTAVMGITAMLRASAAMCGPTVTGLLAEGDHFGLAFIAAGVCRLVYDFGLYALFVGYERGKKLQDRGDGDDDDDEDEMSRNGEASNQFELESIASSESSENLKAAKEGFERVASIHGGLRVPAADGLERVRSRSPHRSAGSD